MNNKTAVSLAATFLIGGLFLSAAAQERLDFNLDKASSRDSFQAPAAGAPVPQPADADAASLAGISQEELDTYLDDGEPETAYQKDAVEPEPRKLSGDGTVTLYHQWRKETLEVRYRDEAGVYLPEAFEKIKKFFRCRLTNKEMDIYPGLIEILDALQDKFKNKEVTLLCGYRSPELNSKLAKHSSLVAKHSLHMQGMAADIMIPGVKLSALRDAAKALKAGGVGYYPDNHFVHVDAGPIRYW